MCAEVLCGLLAPCFFMAFITAALCVPLRAGVAADEEGVPFTPRKDAIDLREKPKKEPGAAPMPVQHEFSFLRYEGAFRNLCDALAGDGRRERVIEVGREVLATETECLSCKALWRTIVAACLPRAERYSRRPHPRRTPSDAPVETPTPAIERHTGERLLSIEVVEVASEISIRMHKDEPDEAPNLLALKRVMQRLLVAPGLSPAESDYYSALQEYLCSAWQGRASGSRM